MHFLGTVWSGALLLMGTCRCVWTTASDIKHVSSSSTELDHKRWSPWDGLFAQKNIGTDSPVDHQPCPNLPRGGEGCCQTTALCGMNGHLASTGTAVTIIQPKITAPPLFKRKVGSTKWDMVHEQLYGRKRDEPQCSPGFQSCAASLNGGCCPNDRVCGTESCYAASSPPATACGVSGYIACGIAEGGTFCLVMLKVFY